jgi:hypothetical protein
MFRESGAQYLDVDTLIEIMRELKTESGHLAGPELTRAL